MTHTVEDGLPVSDFKSINFINSWVKISICGHIQAMQADEYIICEGKLYPRNGQDLSAAHGHPVQWL